MHIDVPLVTRLVAEQFPDWADMPIEPVELSGWDNRTFRLGDELSVRLPSAARYAAQVEKEHTWLPRIARRLPLPIPVPLAAGQPAHGYPWPWSIRTWLPGENAAIDRIGDLKRFATDLGDFLVALQRIDPTSAPRPGKHNFFRGGSLSVYDAETRESIDALRGAVDAEAVSTIWDSALQATWLGSPVWLHGDVAQGNLLVQGGRLSGVIDFGGLAAGDPACDTTIAWTLLNAVGRAAFRERLSVDDGTWARGRGWAMWKALITFRKHRRTNARAAAEAQRVIDEIVRDCEDEAPPR